ncbi:MAG: type II toxin-antitoxin system ParD family antitoxin [Spirulina sp. SIO3F2]|nr:type II toxin-antitoxin system ParD family antitoxin [Spirulina sp. SIO3F2]
MKTMNISLPETLRDYVDEQIEAGGYGTVSEYIRDLIRQDQRRKAKARVEALLLEGLDSGEATPMTEADWTAIRQTVQERIRQK